MAIRKPAYDHLPTIDELATGGVVPSDGSSQNYETGSWRTERPTYDPSICTQCFTCWVFCPDSSIIIRDGKVAGIDIQHCKGCGICAKECPTKPVKSLIMVAGGAYEGNEMFDRRQGQ